MKYERKSFSVPMPGDAVRYWPFESCLDATAMHTVCGECGALRAPGVPHTDARDEGRPKRRVCFGKVVVK